MACNAEGVAGGGERSALFIHNGCAGFVEAELVAAAAAVRLQSVCGCACIIESTITQPVDRAWGRGRGVPLQRQLKIKVNTVCLGSN